MNRGSLKRRLLRQTPILSRLATSLDALEAENQALRDRLAPVLLSEERPGGEGEDLDAAGLPWPPVKLRDWVAGTGDRAWFQEGGQLGVQTLMSLLGKHGVELAELGSVLDFGCGCGCGRVLRHLRRFDRVRIHGTDSNPAAIAWCNEHLDFAEFGTNRLEPPTRYRPHSFDLIYAFSVFTHLTETLQLACMREMRRILKPGGWLIITLHGDHYLPHINVTARAQYQRGELVVLGEEVVGQNACAAFHPESYVRNVLARDFEVVDLVPEGALGNPKQDAYLLRPKA